jgi:hypothetical protein
LVYYQKVVLAVAFGLTPTFESSLRSLGKLCSKFARRIDTKLEANEVNALYDSFHGDDKQIIQAAYQRTRRGMSSEKPKSSSKLEPEERFSLIAIGLQAALVSEIRRLSGERKKETDLLS